MEPLRAVRPHFIQSAVLDTDTARRVQSDSPRIASLLPKPGEGNTTVKKNNLSQDEVSKFVGMSTGQHQRTISPSSLSDFSLAGVLAEVWSHAESLTGNHEQ